MRIVIRLSRVNAQQGLGGGGRMAVSAFCLMG